MRILSTVGAALLIVGCGGASAPPPSTPPEPAAAPAPPDPAAARVAAQAFVAELYRLEQAAEAEEPVELDGLAALVSATRFTVLVGYEDADAGGCDGGACVCEASVTDRQLAGDPFACLVKSSVGFAPSDDQLTDWSAEAMADFTWQIDESAISGWAGTARLFIYRAPETLYVLAVVADDDGAARVAAVYSGLTYE